MDSNNVLKLFYAYPTHSNRIKTDDPQSLRDARPDRTEPFLLQVGVARFDDFDAKIDPIFAQVGTVSITTS